jgi:SAM-dependent methyltransferase
VVSSARTRLGGKAAAPPLPLSCLTNPKHYDDPRWRELHLDLLSYSFDRHVFLPEVYRKGWEWTQTIWGLERLGMLAPQHRALGVGAGRESVIFWLADRLQHVVATDLYGNEMWSNEGGREADPLILQDPGRFCPRPVDRTKVSFLPMNGLALGIRDESFDVVWSLSSIEHFGGHANAAKSVQEMARVTRPGGIVVVATEVLLLDEYTHVEYFNRAQFEEHVIGASPLLELVDPMDWTLPPDDYLIDSIVVPAGVTRWRRHVVLNDGQVQWTSGITFLRRVPA